MLLALDLRPAQVGVMLARLSTLKQNQTLVKMLIKSFFENMNTYVNFWVLNRSRRKLISCAHRLISETINVRRSRLLGLKLNRYL